MEKESTPCCEYIRQYFNTNKEGICLRVPTRRVGDTQDDSKGGDDRSTKELDVLEGDEWLGSRCGL